MIFQKPRLIKKIVHRKCCVRCGWFERMSPFSRNRDSCPECRGELLFQRGIVTTQTNGWFFWRELEFKQLESQAFKPVTDSIDSDEWLRSPVWLN